MFYASMQFDLGEDVNAMRDMVHSWAQERIKPIAAEVDSSNEFPAALWREMGEMGLLGITVPDLTSKPKMGVFKIYGASTRRKTPPGSTLLIAMAACMCSRSMARDQPRTGIIIRSEV